MGGTPIGTFLSIAIPPDMDVEYLDELMGGYHAISQKYNVPLLGGDTTKSVRHLAINVCVLGKIEKGKARLRSMAQTGDAIAVTGWLGDSAGGLKVILEKLEQQGDYAYLAERHHLPEPCLDEGLFLRKFGGVHAMMDISDGIASDLVHILKASGKAAQVDLDRLPVSPALTRVCLAQDWQAGELAGGGGEDYELLFTVAPDCLPELKKAFSRQFKKPLTIIGKVEEGAPGIQWLQNGRKVAFSKGGFNHFQ
jgi:thiamine-monophosphate kinase